MVIHLQYPNCYGNCRIYGGVTQDMRSQLQVLPLRQSKLDLLGWPPNVFVEMINNKKPHILLRKRKISH